MRLIPPFLALCCAFVSTHGMAAPLRDLYQVREPVASQQPAERDEALRKAFDTLVLRLTGNAESDRPALAELRKDPQQLVSRYAYEDNAVVVSFDPTTTERALRSAGLSLWGADRPSLLTWWLSESPEGTQLIGDAQSGASELRAAAQHRGLPLLLPLADLGEQLAATADTLTAQEPQALREASDRYDADGLLAVLAEQSGEAWAAQWRLWLGDKQTQGKASASSRAALADEILLAVSRYLAPQYRVAPGATTELTLEVRGADVGRFAELDRLLEPFAARLQRIEGDRLFYRLNASPEQLRAQLQLARLQEIPPEELQAPPAESGATAGADDTAPIDAEAAPEAPASAPVVPVAEPYEQGDVLHYRW